MFKNGDKIGIVCCSNGQKQTYRGKIKILENTLLEIGLQPVFSDCIYEKDGIFCGTAGERASALMDFYKNDKIRGIFDISGGDVANGILPYLDYEFIAGSRKMLWGYSDLTTVLNAIYTKTGKASVLYQIRNLIYDHKERQIEDFRNMTMCNGRDLFQWNYEFVRQSAMRGIVVGGNIRCFLKLAGTEYMPDMENKILFLESLNGDVAKIETYFCQLKQLGAFDKVAGIILGTFTEMERDKYVTTAAQLLKKMVSENLPIAVTEDIGHGTDSKAIVIGQELCLQGGLN